MEDFPSNCEVLILGTGLVESIVGAACSRIGKSVVVLDRNNFYGGDWATFSVRNLIEWLGKRSASEYQMETNSQPVSLQKDEIAFEIPQIVSPNITDISYWSFSKENRKDIQSDDNQENIDQDLEPNATSSDSVTNSEVFSLTREQKEELLDDLDKYGNRFNISLCSKILIARGQLVQLLVDSATSRYCEFLALHDLNFLYHSKFQKVPSSRSDVFKNSLISLVEKRQMMRVLEFCMNEETVSLSQEENSVPFVTYLQTVHAVSERLAHIIVMHVLYQAKDASTENCLSRLRVFCESLGVYSNSPYLFAMYGVGELPQCFARMNAIFGGVFILGSEEAPAKLITANASKVTKETEIAEKVNSNHQQSRACAVVTASGKVITCEHLVSESSYLPKSLLPTFVKSRRSYVRGVFITSRRLDSSKESAVVLVSIPPPEGRRHPLRLIEETAQACSTHEKFYLLQAITEDEDSSLCSKEQIDLYLNQLIKPLSSTEEDSRVAYITSLYFRYLFVETSSDESPLQNVHVTSGPDSELGFDQSVEQARGIFSKIFPNEEFLPRAPDPSDVIIGETEPQSTSEPDGPKEGKSNQETAEIDSNYEEKIIEDEQAEEKVENVS
ncbi:rab proteins geranylgeranyltransferase component A 1-like [Symsagittifera roscoffensis]|uniref:rab proteins geranylgeranyltransferase component A 1-like n=1 Tax=Symsagittifera roscoffensis TaxID=84072 RepID=UPI00307B51E7